jgi:hypothetical protein
MPDVDFQHAPKCERSGVDEEEGTTVTVARCIDCGAVSTTRKDALDE